MGIPALRVITRYESFAIAFVGASLGPLQYCYGVRRGFSSPGHCACSKDVTGVAFPFCAIGLCTIHIAPNIDGIYNERIQCRPV